MLDRFLAADAAYDGRFVTGVKTTGIYCLPSCTAKKPRPENVTFFDAPQDALAAGFRACRRCRPDDWYAGRDPDRERLETAVAAMRAAPERFGGVNDMARAALAGERKLNVLVRTHYHTTPGSLLTHARVDAATRQLDAGVRATDVAFSVGFESLSAFNENYRRWTGLRPTDRSRLADDDTFRLRLPPGFRVEPVLRIHGRDGESPTEGVRGRTLWKVLATETATARMELSFVRGAADVRVRGGDRPTMRAAHAAALRMLGLHQDPGPFERRIARKPALRGLIAGRRGTRIPLTATPFEALVWCIVGQQVNLAFAYELRRTVIELTGRRGPYGTAHPDAAAVAGLDYADLTSRRFSRRKAEYVIDTARAIAAGNLDLDALPSATATTAESMLLGVRGLGPWSVNYLMMRGLGFGDCVPVGDTGLSTALQRFFDLEGRPDAHTTGTLMEPFAPYRSLASFHLWQSLGDAP